MSVYVEVKAGCASRSIATTEDVREVIALLRLDYDRAIEHHDLPEPGA